jgi:ABC-type Mn2+/Zn2+ transport system ATPase subunit
MLLLDEPMSGVDALTEDDVFNLLDDLKSDGVSVIMTTHDLSCVAERFDYVLLLNRRVVAFGPAETAFTEENLRRTFGSHLTLVKVGERYLAVEDAEHHERHDPHHRRELARTR